MMAPDLETAISRLRGLIDEAERIVPFTGAGISTECGIPDFRSPGGLWSKNQPIPFDAFLASQDMRNESWRRRFAMDDNFAKAKPGRGHRALASLYRAGKVPGLVTQNIDNLHQLSGIAPHDIVELHGNTTYALCSIAQSVTSCRGSAKNSAAATIARPIVPAAATSRPQPSRSDSRCRSRQWRAPRN
jgi:NAD-dependent deacetylase